MSDKVKDNATLFHDYGIFLPTTTIEITGEIDEDQYQKTVKNLHMLEFCKNDITIILNSDGGDVIHGRAIYDAIKSCSQRVKIHVVGQACSTASFILQAGDERVISPNSILMLHVGEEGHSSGHPRNIEAWHNLNRDLEKWMEDTYLTRIKQVKKKYTRNQLKSLLQFDRILKPKEALEMGLIDRIGEGIC